MLLSGYTKEIFRSKCMPGAQSFHCYAYLNEDIDKVIPYLNTVLGGTTFTKEPPSVTFKVHGKLIGVQAKKIAINALKDEDEADKILTWLQNEINTTWEDHENIEPCFDSAQRPVLTEILKLLPKSNCKECGEPTCMVFAVKTMEGVKDEKNCPGLTVEGKNQLHQYLSQFRFE